LNYIDIPGRIMLDLLWFFIHKYPDIAKGERKLKDYAKRFLNQSE
jgi:hypothetical protein